MLRVGFVLALLAAQASAPEEEEELPEVRQLVAFDFLPGQTAEAIRIFREEALPLYVEAPAMLRFRAYREAESPEPLDLVVVSTFRGMAGMDASNRAIAAGAEKRGTSIGALYGKIGALTEGHRDLFVEMDPALSWGDVEAAPLVVFVSLRTVPGGATTYEEALESLLAWERSSGWLSGSECGRFLLSSGDTHFRTLGIGSLDAWHRYVNARRQQPFWSRIEGVVAESRQQILVPVPELSVR